MGASIARKRTRLGRRVLCHKLAQGSAFSCIMTWFSCAAMVFRYSKRARTFCCYGVCTDQPCCRLEEDICSLDTRADGWCTTFNASKSAHMFISSKHRRSGDTSRSSLSLSGGIILLVRTTAHLGVRISSTLSWSDYVSNIIRRVKFKAFFTETPGSSSRICWPC